MPNALDFKRRMKFISLGLGKDILLNNTPTQCQDIDREAVVPVVACPSAAGPSAAGPSAAGTSVSFESLLQKVDEITNVARTITFSSPEKLLSTSEGIKYLAGYLAHKANEPALGIVTPSSSVSANTLHNTMWLSQMTSGSFTIPTPELVNYVWQMELYFQAFHGSGLSLLTCPKVTRTFTRILEEKMPQLPKKVLHLFSKTRTLIRMRVMQGKMINSRHKQSARSKKKNVEWQH